MLIREIITCIAAYANKEFRVELKKVICLLYGFCILSDLSLMLLIYIFLKNLISLERLLSTIILSDIAVQNRTDGMPVLFIYKRYLIYHIQLFL
jgi:hypothetical protein